MALPDRTLCWVEGPPWDRHCEPVADDVSELAAERDAYRTALEHVAYLRRDETPHDQWSNWYERIAREALGLPNEEED